MILKDENIFNYIHLAINTLLYIICIILIIIRKQYTCISMRSPILLITGNIGGFFVSIILILSKIKKYNDYNKIINGFYYVFREMIILSFLMRCKRIIKCYNIINDEEEDIKKFYQKRFLYKEGFYVKIMFSILLFLSLFFFIYDILSKNPITLYFLNDNNDDKVKKINIYIWLLINFIEIMFLLRYAYIMFIKNIKQKIIFELLVFIIIWFIYFNIVQLYSHYYPNINSQNDEIKNNIISCSIIILYINLIISGFFPIILSFCYHTSISFYFGESSLNNLYLFLSNEECYITFYNYLSKKNPINIYYLKFYANVMLYKFDFLNREDEETISNEFHFIYNEYFDNDNQNKFNNNIVNSIKTNFENNIQVNENYFDEALLFAYKILERDFSKFKKFNAFIELGEFLNLQSYIHCKMCNTGLIKKF